MVSIFQNIYFEDILKQVRGGYSKAMARFMLRRPCLEYICGNCVRYISWEKKITKQTNDVKYISPKKKITKQIMVLYIFQEQKITKQTNGVRYVYFS